MRNLKTMLLNAAALFGVFMLGLMILFSALGGRMDMIPDWVVLPMFLVSVLLWALLSPWKLIDLERRREDAETNARKWRGEAMNLDIELRAVRQRLKTVRQERDQARGRLEKEKQRTKEQVTGLREKYVTTREELAKLKFLIREQIDADALLTEVEQRAGQDLAVKLRNSIADAEEHRRDVEALTEENERLQILLAQATATAMEMQDRHQSVLNLITKHFCAKGEHLPGEPDDHGIVYCAACDEILNADDPNESPCCGGEDCGNDSCGSCGACAPAEENRE